MIVFKRLLLFCLLACLSAALYAQDEAETDDEGGDEIDVDWGDYEQTKYTLGDKTFTFTAGAVFPVLFSNNGAAFDSNQTVGATLTAIFDYFVSPDFAVGGEIGLISTGSRGSNMLYVIPIGARVQYQFNIWIFEFPISVSIGMCPTKFLDYANFTMYVRGTVSAYWRFNPDWSFGLSAAWTYIPMWAPDKNSTSQGNYIGAALTARYHF
jgi:hypothetical protein